MVLHPAMALDHALELVSQQHMNLRHNGHLSSFLVIHDRPSIEDVGRLKSPLLVENCKTWYLLLIYPAILLMYQRYLDEECGATGLCAIGTLEQ